MSASTQSQTASQQQQQEGNPVPAIILIQNSETEGANYLGYFRDVLPRMPNNLYIVHYKMFKHDHLALLPQRKDGREGEVETDGAMPTTTMADTLYCYPSADPNVAPRVMWPCASTGPKAAGKAEEGAEQQSAAAVIAFRPIGVISFGGPMGAYEDERHRFLRNVTRCVKAAVDADLPYLGICLGAQLLAKAFGGECFKHDKWEFAFVPEEVDPIACYATEAEAEKARAAGIHDWFGGRKTLNSFQAHGDTFTIPDRFVRIATGAYCANQAFQLPHKYVLGVQWHPDVDRPKADHWVSLLALYMKLGDDDMSPPGIHTVGQLKAALQAGEMLAETNALADSIFGKWLEGIYLHHAAVDGLIAPLGIPTCSSSTVAVIEPPLVSIDEASSPDTASSVGPNTSASIAAGHTPVSVGVNKPMTDGHHELSGTAQA